MVSEKWLIYVWALGTTANLTLVGLLGGPCLCGVLTLVGLLGGPGQCYLLVAPTLGLAAALLAHGQLALPTEVVRLLCRVTATLLNTGRGARSIATNLHNRNGSVR